MKHSHWQPEEHKAVQVAFDIAADAQQVIKQAAMANDLNPPDQIRKILGLPYHTRPVRPRLTVTLKDEDFVLLGQRYGLPPQDHAGIREKMAEELLQFVRRNQP